MLAADTDRERVEVALREHYVGGRLTLEEFTERAGRVSTARCARAELRGALSGLPALPDVDDIATPIRSAARVAIRGAVLVVATGAYLVFSVMLLLVLGLALLFGAASAAVLVAFLAVWLVPTVLLTRLWHGRPRRAPVRSAREREPGEAGERARRRRPERGQRREGSAGATHHRSTRPRASAIPKTVSATASAGAAAAWSAPPTPIDASSKLCSYEPRSKRRTGARSRPPARRARRRSPRIPRSPTACGAAASGTAARARRRRGSSGTTSSLPVSIHVRPRTRFSSFSDVVPCARRWCHHTTSQATPALANARLAALTSASRRGGGPRGPTRAPRPATAPRGRRPRPSTRARRDPGTRPPHPRTRGRTAGVPT